MVHPEILQNRYALGFLPTPIQKLERFTQESAPYSLYVKRDDQTGLATGGNKTRKLEYLVKEALNFNCDTLITAGAQQSNHCRQTAAAAAQLGLECHLLLGGTKPNSYSGNLLLSQLLGAKIHFTGADRKGEQLTKVKKTLEVNGKQCYIIPYGGSNLIGALGFVNAIAELKQQEQVLSIEFDHIVFASSSGGTQAGMILGKELFGLKAQLHPISIDKEGISGQDLDTTVLDLVNAGAKKLRLTRSFSIEECRLNKNFESPGYGVLTKSEISSIKFLAVNEGIVLDPVYTGRAFSALRSMINNQVFAPKSKILFWHTGGTPAIFSKSGMLLA